jgi:cytochrome b
VTALIWPAWLRLLHWTLVAAVLGAGLSGWALFGLLPWHEACGTTALAVVVLRLAGGWRRGKASAHARWDRFVQGPRTTARYLRLSCQGRAPRYLGHNPLGAWMIVALLTCVSLLGLTGWLATTDRYWGEAWLAHLHLGLAWTLTGLVAGHLTGVAMMSWLHRENLVRAMLTGRKRVDGQEADAPASLP